MQEVKIENASDSIVVNDLIGHYVKYDRVNLDHQKKYLADCNRFLNTINLLPLIYDKIVALSTLPGFPENRFKEFEEAAIIATPIFAVENDYNLSFEEFCKIINVGDRDRKSFNFIRINLEKEKDLLNTLLTQDQRNKDYISDIAEKTLSEWGPLFENTELALTINHFLNDINFSLVVSENLGLPILTKSTHLDIWQKKFRILIREIEELGKADVELSNIVNMANAIEKKAKDPILLNNFFQKVEIRFPSGLSIDDIIAFRKDNARRNFKEWLFSEVAAAEKEEKSEETEVIVDKLVKDFNELSKSMVNETKTHSGLLNASLTGVSTGFAALINPFLAIPAAALSPYLLDKPTLGLCVKLLKKHSKRNWVFFFLEFASRERK